MYLKQIRERNISALSLSVLSNGDSDTEDEEHHKEKDYVNNDTSDSNHGNDTNNIDNSKKEIC